MYRNQRKQGFLKEGDLKALRFLVAHYQSKLYNSKLHPTHDFSFLKWIPKTTE